ncbi:MAG TPA: hypothetical protein DCM26_04180 [Desulfotomaculum sp.]|nr:hypothetical protein [Desulfotomaculum sp.]
MESIAIKCISHDRYIGGLAKQSPICLQIPSSGHWHIAVDMQGLRGTVRSSALVLPGSLPTIREIPRMVSCGFLVNDPVNLWTFNTVYSWILCISSNSQCFAG